ncbi:hypothetical protein [Pseudomonas huanghezhanensis]|uniref:hypothetical protein n=1 Tax=Pseudomonas huanghezhanensis TaxID=3002903 RepID=UPI0022865DF2|nr:hypothetical protein [Pseudomonas sp. BSw22131]
MEKYKFLYELSKKALDEELDRYKKLDEKASRFLSILSFRDCRLHRSHQYSSEARTAIGLSWVGRMGVCNFVSCDLRGAVLSLVQDFQQP